MADVIGVLIADDHPFVRHGLRTYLATLEDIEVVGEAADGAEAVRKASRGEALLAPSVAAKLMQEVAGDRPASSGLTDRELEVLRLIARGLPNKLIAQELVVSEKTVKTHVSNILAKLHLADRTQAALFAVREGLAELE